MKCPFCGYNNIAGVDACDHCDEDLTAVTATSKSKMERLLTEDPLAKVSPREALRVRQDTPVWEAVLKMNAGKVGCTLVESEKEELVGILTERDILFRMPDQLDALKKMKVSELMTPDVDTLPSNAPLAAALHHMSVNRYRHIPVTHEGANPQIISTRDILKYLGKYLLSKS